LLEPVFFHFVGEQRKSSIYCVPLNYTYIPGIYKNNLETMIQKWHKYTALNIKPLTFQGEGPGFGTIEFRHLFGTGDFEIYNKWISALEEWYLWHENNPAWSVVQTLKDGSSPASIAYEVIPSLSAGLSAAFINKICEDTLIDVKLSVGGLK
jgi:hypothetical protein